MCIFYEKKVMFTIKKLYQIIVNLLKQKEKKLMNSWRWHMTVLLLIFISRAGPRKIFVRNKKNYCNRDTNFCDGSSEAPFGSLVEVFNPNREKYLNED